MEKLKDGRLKLSESLFSPVPPSAFGVFDKRLKFPQLFTAYLGILTVWLQTYTPKIRVNTYHHLSDFDFFLHPNLEAVKLDDFLASPGPSRIRK